MNTHEITVIEPEPTITLTNPDGREAVIDFGGDSVRYEGDLPVDESARIFFEVVGGLLVDALKEGL